MLKYCIIILFWNSSYQVCSCYAHFIIERDKRPSDWHLTLPTLHRRYCHRWSKRYSPDGGCRFSKFSQLTLPNLLRMRLAIIPAQCSNTFGLQ